jgi:hypothetical protein
VKIDEALALRIVLRERAGARTLVFSTDLAKN